MLAIDYDIKDALITTPGLSMIDPPMSFIPVIKKGGASCPYMVPPTGRCLMLAPIQLLPGWASQPKFQIGDYGNPTGWEPQQTRGTNDYWMHAEQGNITPLSLAYTFPANTGWFVEFRGYAQPKTLPIPILDFNFGQFFQLVIWSDGRAELSDSRQTTSGPIGIGNIANSKSFANGDVSLVILPYRRTQILVWSPTLGGYFEATVQVGTDGNITESCAPSVYSAVTPPSAFVAISPLLYPADGIAPISAPPKILSSPLTQTPSFTSSLYDIADYSTVTYSAVTPYVAMAAPVNQFVYSIQMQGNSDHQTAEAQGVIGIATGTTGMTGDGIFGGGSYPYSLVTPFVYLTEFGYQRGLSNNAYTTNTLTGILKANLKLSEDRTQKSFVFMLDNPANLTGIGANYTSLKDLENRRMRAYFTNKTLAGGSTSHSAIAADPDPHTPLIVENGYQPVYIFDGLGTDIEFTDGVNSFLKITCQGLRKRLKNYIFPDQPLYDGMVHTLAVTDILKRAGFVAATDGAVGLGTEIFCATDDTTLPSATAGDTPNFTPVIGATGEEILEKILQYTGWVLDDLIPFGATNSCWYYVPQSYYAASVYESQGSPAISQTSTYNSGFTVGSMPLPDQCVPCQGLGSLVMTDSPSPQQTTEEVIANFVMVIGSDQNEQPIVAQAIDWGSITDRTQTNYVAEKRVYILISQDITTQAAANKVCAIIFNNLSQARPQVTCTIPDYYPQLGISAPVSPDGYWNGQISSVDADLSDLRSNPTKLTIKKALAA